MQDIELTLKCAVSRAFRSQKAANSLDIDAEKKSVHHILIKNVDLDADYNLGLIVGASGSGKTTLAEHLFGDCFQTVLNGKDPVIEQFPKGLSYDDCAALLSGVGLTAVPCWIRPAMTLSNGQRARAEIALQMARKSRDVVVIDEWTSVVDRTVAKVMSHSVQKHVRRTDKKIILCSCHYDVIEWLNPDWIIDCNRQEFIDRRRLRSSFVRKEKLQFEIAEVGRETWRLFSKYHYLTDTLPTGKVYYYGLFCGDDQVGFICWSALVPRAKGLQKIFHGGRIVVHPDYVGLGLGGHLINETARLVHGKGHRVYAKFSSTPVYRLFANDPRWALRKIERKHKVSMGRAVARGGGRMKTYRLDVKTYSFEYVPAKKRGRSKATPKVQ